jgi:hypothetical protein
MRPEVLLIAKMLASERVRNGLVAAGQGLGLMEESAASANGINCKKEGLMTRKECSECSKGQRERGVFKWKAAKEKP